jgi:diguanylate cyclase (GGDEF)-like protein
LTHLPNRRFFDLWMGKCVAMASRGERDLSLIALDLDSFKLVNDDDGHEAGDTLLIDIATAFKATLRGSDFLCRTGGDEFTVVTSDGANHEAVERLATRLIAAVERAAGTSKGARAAVTVSAGIAIYPTDGATAEELMKAADLALYSAKTHGKGQARFHSPQR